MVSGSSIGLTNLHKLVAASLVYGALACSWSAISTEVTIRVPAPRSAFDVSHDYHVKLLKLALSPSKNKYVVRQMDLPLNQGRAQIELEKGELLDLYWFGADSELDRQLAPIPVPTTRGLIGFRKFFIRSDMEAEFAKVQTLDDLSRFVACQGRHWPDSKILASANLSVTSSPNYETLFRMLDLGRCDYFPRGIHDFLTELELRRNRYPNLTQHNAMLLYYPFGVYFYTNKKQQGLADDLHEGMALLATSGRLLAFMKEHPLTRNVFVSEYSYSEKIIKLSNPLMTTNLRVNDKNFWFQPDYFLKQ